MPENILVVEYEPRYTDRVRQALAGQPFVPAFAKDGEEAMKVLDGEAPRLIVLSSVVPKISTSELIRVIRSSTRLSTTPILLTVSGYSGKSPKADAVKMGASDILPKPYSESEFLGKIQQMLGVRGDAASARQWTPELDPEFTVRPNSVPTPGGGQLTSNEIFGELLEDDRAPSSGARKAMKPTDDLDKMLADTLAGVRQAPKKKDAPAAVPAAPASNAPQPAAPSAASPSVRPMDPAAAKPKSGSSDFDKMLNDTLSGLEKNSRPRPAPAPVPPPAAPKPTPAPAPAVSKYNTDKMPAFNPDKIPASQPVFPQAAAAAPVPAPLVAPFEDDEPSDGTKFGQYVMLDRIATGGMAEVWKARMKGVEGFQKIVAIKKILPHLSDNQDFIEMFVDEAKLAAQLNHNNIIHIYDLGKIQNSYYIAMEYIDGHDLKTILRRGEERDQPMQVELALFIASKVAAALDYAHRKHDFEGKDLGLVHRDVSPQNVLISQEGDIKLCDFGIAKAASKASHTQAGALKGKLQYMSPEQAWGRHVDKRSDIFALATVLFEMLTGRKLFTGDNELSILEQVREAQVTTPSELNEEVTPEIDKIVLKALQKDPEKRYQTAGEMAKDLDAVLYTFRPTPTSADLAIYMHRIWSAEPIAQIPQHHHEVEEHHDPKELRPLVKPSAVIPSVIPAAAPVVVPTIIPPAASTPSFGYGEETAAKKPPIIPIAIAAIVVIALIGGYFAMRSKTPAPAAGTAPVTASTTQTAAPTTAPPSTTAATTSVAPAGTTQAPALDTAQVNAEVQKRIAAEKARLEQQQRAQQAAATPSQQPTPQPVRPVPAPVTATQAAAPPPVQEVTPAPVPQPPPQVVERPAPQPAAPTVRPGDIVAAGTEGLVPPRRTSSPALQYPLMARQQRVEGSVLLSVLISETGKVLDVRVLRGVNRAVGLNEAAEQQVRRSTFAPGNKDGVPVKVWIPVTIDFKL